MTKKYTNKQTTLLAHRAHLCQFLHVFFQTSYKYRHCYCLSNLLVLQLMLVKTGASMTKIYIAWQTTVFERAQSNKHVSCQ